MPKIIKDIENIIFEKSEEIFIKNGYSNTDMKAIAKACDIAVGTLYNYYPNKKSIYISVFVRSWDKTIKKLKSIKVSDDKKTDLKNCIKIFYLDVEERNGLGNDLRDLCGKGDVDFDEMVKKVFRELTDCTIKRFELKGKFKDMEDTEKKIMTVWFVSLCAIKNEFPLSKNKNIEFLYNTVSNYFDI